MEDYIDREESLGQIRRICAADLEARHMISPFGVIPRRHRRRKSRLIVNLSVPEGYSVIDFINAVDFINAKLSSVSYTSINDAVAFIRRFGVGCLLAKLMEVYRAVPVHPSDQLLLAMRWRDTVYIDRALPFPLQSFQLLRMGSCGSYIPMGASSLSTT